MEIHCFTVIVVINEIKLLLFNAEAPVALCVMQKTPQLNNFKCPPHGVIYDCRLFATV